MGWLCLPIGIVAIFVVVVVVNAAGHTTEKENRRLFEGNTKGYPDEDL